MITLVFGFARLQKSVYLPFFKPASSYVFKTADDLEKERTEKLKIEDTDKDGLNDYDELYVFRTSPFLEDSDSDGFKDGDEISQGFDPNCPRGKTCRQTEVAIGPAPQPSAAPTPVPQQPAGTPTANEQMILKAIVETFGDIDKLTPEKIAEQLKAMSSPDLRIFLLKIGIPQAALDKNDDATLRMLLQETLQELSGSGTQTQPSR
jgi:hypothetical protein